MSIELEKLSTDFTNYKNSIRQVTNGRVHVDTLFELVILENKFMNAYNAIRLDAFLTNITEVKNLQEILKQYKDKVLWHHLHKYKKQGQ